MEERPRVRQEKIKARSKVKQAIRNRCSEDTLLILKKDWLRLVRSHNKSKRVQLQRKKQKAQLSCQEEFSDDF